MKFRYLKLISLIFILIIAAFLRFYHLSSIPNGLQQDETSLGYNAYSILRTGKDEYGKSFPINFKAFGEYKLPGYIYATVLPISFFGVSNFSVRFISALSGVLMVLIAFILIRNLINLDGEINKSTRTLAILPYILALLLAINPWSLFFSRSAFEVNLANTLFIMALALLTFGMQKKKSIFIILAIPAAAASIYTYNIARLFVPVFIISFIILFRKSFRFLRKSEIISVLAAVIILLLPFVYSALSQGGVDSTTGTIIFKSASVQAKLQEIRSYFVDMPIIPRILFNYYTLTGWEYLSNIAAHLSVSFYFLNGGSHGNNTIGTNGSWYLFELPLVILGIISLYRKKSLFGNIILLWISSLILISSLTRDPPQATRTFLMIFPITALSAYGLSVLFERIIKLNLSLKIICIFIISGFMLWSVIFYFSSYYLRFPLFYAKPWRSAEQNLGTFLKLNSNNYDKIIIDPSTEIKYTSILYHTAFPPDVFQNTSRRTTDDSEGFNIITSFGNYQFREINWKNDMNLPNTLLITKNENIPNDIQPLKAFYYPKRPVVISLGQEIVRYPIEEIAFVIITTKK